MSNTVPEEGRYYIIPAFYMQPSPGLGADIVVPPETPLPVVFNGNEQVWDIIRRPDGFYYFNLKGWKAVDREYQVVVDPFIGLGELWAVEPRDGGCLITIANSGMAWTLLQDDEENKPPVVLQPAREPYPNQLWFFKRAD